MAARHLGALAIPRTDAEIARAVATVQDTHPTVEGYVWQGKQYEGLVVLYNTLVNSNGGTILDENGTKAIVDEKAVQALAALKKLATSKAIDPSFSNAAEDNARLAMEGGNAAWLMRYETSPLYDLNEVAALEGLKMEAENYTRLQLVQNQLLRYWGEKP